MSTSMCYMLQDRHFRLPLPTGSMETMKKNQVKKNQVKKNEGDAAVRQIDTGREKHERGRQRRTENTRRTHREHTQRGK